MRRRAAALAAATATLATALVGLTATPAAAHSLYDIVRASGGCGWSSGSYDVLDSRAVSRYNGEQYGTVYLLWSGSYGQNCVVTRKTKFHGTPTYTYARLDYRSSGSGAESYVMDEGQYGHYAAVTQYTRGQCVKFSATIDSGGQGGSASGGRTTWGNCG